MTDVALGRREPTARPFRLTSLAHGGGCGCKLAPSVLQQLLGKTSLVSPFDRLLVGAETGDDAAVWRLDDENCIIATTDFFMPIVDDPHDFGRIAATNAISDVYAMGGSPLMALAIVGMPIDKIPLDIVRDILAGGAAACAEAGIPVAGGHSIDSPEPIYGLAVIGRCRRENLRKNSTARAGDALILTKPLGVGVYSAAFKKGALPDEAYAEMIETTTRLNKIGALLGHDPKTHAMTDVTGFGLLGHALEIARGSSLRVRLDLSALPFLSHAESLVRAGFVTGASKRNWESYGESVNFEDEPPLWRRQLLTDPQTSGGLLIACAADEASRLAEEIRAADCPGASIVGQTEAGNPEIIVG